MGIVQKVRGKAVFEDIHATTKTIGASEIEDAAITSAKLANSAVTGAKIASGAVSLSKLADDAIRESKLKGEKLSGTIVTAGTAVTVSHTLGAAPALCFVVKGDAYIESYDSTSVRVNGAAGDFEVYVLA